MLFLVFTKWRDTYILCGQLEKLRVSLGYSQTEAASLSDYSNTMYTYVYVNST